jgi:hypothetical protein
MRYAFHRLGFWYNALMIVLCFHYRHLFFLSLIWLQP